MSWSYFTDSDFAWYPEKISLISSSFLAFFSTFHFLTSFSILFCLLFLLLPLLFFPAFSFYHFSFPSFNVSFVFLSFFNWSESAWKHFNLGYLNTFYSTFLGCICKLLYFICRFIFLQKTFSLFKWQKIISHPNIT